MKPGRLLGAIILVGAVGAGSFYAARTVGKRIELPVEGDFVDAQAPDVVIEPPSLDFGEQEWGQTLPGEFALVNLRDEPVIIESIQTNCGCAIVAEHKDVVVAPGDVFTFQFTLDTQLSTGHKTRNITVSLVTGERLLAPVSLMVRGTFELSHQFVEFGDVLIAGTAEAARTVFFKSDRGREIREVSTNCTWAETFVARRAGGQEILVRLLTEKLAPGWSTGALRVVTDDETVPVVSVPITVRGVQGLTPTPTHVFLRGEEKRVVSFVTGARKAAQISSVRTSDPRISATIVDRGRVEIGNPGGEALPDTAIVYVSDERGQTGRVLVSTF